jgi:hypothetical protein
MVCISMLLMHLKPGDEDSRNGKLFAFRFLSHVNLSKTSLPQSACKSFLEAPTNNAGITFFIQSCLLHKYVFIYPKYVYLGKLSSPSILLVLGSLRILTRNVTLDDLYRQTYISGEVHRCFN